jgi:carbonic anhydrase
MDSPTFPQLLLDGYRGFLTARYPRERDRFERLAEKGQHPHTLVIGCCDSRVTPEEIFNALPGEIFDVRNVANLVPPSSETNYHHGSWAAIDYAVSNLRVKHIVVLGHARCGGVRAYVERHAAGAAPAKEEHDYIGDWIATLARAVAQVGPVPPAFDPAYAEALAKASIRQGLENLRSFPKVAEGERRGDLTLHGAYFEIDDAKLFGLDEATGAFVQIARCVHEQALVMPRF